MCFFPAQKSHCSPPSSFDRMESSSMPLPAIHTARSTPSIHAEGAKELELVVDPRVVVGLVGTGTGLGLGSE